MASTYAYERVSPIGDTEPMNMPVADIDAAIAWYESKMGFTVKSRTDDPVAAAGKQFQESTGII